VVSAKGEAESFARVIEWNSDGSSDGSGAWVGTVPSSWMQGRTSFGGIAAAVGFRALRLVEGEGRAPRSVHTSFFAPLRAEPARVTAEVIRRGRFLTHARAEIRQEGALRTQVTATFADDRDSGVIVEAPVAPERPDPEGLVDLPYIEGTTPAFVRHFALRFTDGAVPFSGASEARLGGYCRYRGDPGPDPHVALLGLLDVWPSPLVALFERPAPASSVTWTTNFVDVPDVIDPQAWWWYASEAVAAGDGYATMRGMLYGSERGLVATVEQLVALFDRPSP